MRTIHLPHTLRPGSKLATINAQLRTGEARLDWSAVRAAPEAALTALLNGLDLVDDADRLGLDTVPDELSRAVMAVLRRGDASDPEPAGAPATSVGERPAVWDPPESAAAASGATQETGDGVADGSPKGAPVEATALDDGAPILAGTMPSPAELRDLLEAMVVKDLLGPAGGPEEVVDERRVIDRYLVGMLAPKRGELTEAPAATSVGADTAADGPAFILEDDTVAEVGPEVPEEGEDDPEASGPHTLFPSSFGLSFVVDGSARALRVTARWGRYERVERPEADETTAGSRRIWRRVPMEGTHPCYSLREGPLERWEVVPDRPGVVVHGLARRHDGDWVVTLFLVNEQCEPRRLKDTAWLFQPELIVEGVDGAAVFCRRPLPSRVARHDSTTEAEDAALAMLYRHRREFAVGHGVSVDWDPPDPADGSRTRRVMTRAMPAYEVGRTDPPQADELPDLRDLELDMQVLGTLKGPALQAALRPLAQAYAAWIARQRARLTPPEPDLVEHVAAANAALATCERTLARIEEGIALLARDPQAEAAFRFANRAMALQRIRSLYAERVRRGESPSLEELDQPANHRWYPFQLAFILLNLPSLTDLAHPDRGDDTDAVVDLLWFPTGGGKTEAYLGLTAYVLALRRLQGVVDGRSGDGGVAVLMRYTLRLLTLQQFQRAAALICACELLRRKDEARWGREPFRLGLWVGGGMTPNTTERSKEALQRGHQRGSAGGVVAGTGTPDQLTHCPWCGAEIDAGRNIRVKQYPSGPGRTFIYCGDRHGGCPFTERQSPREGLPVVVVDEEIYRLLPALLIATVDKFAQMPWKGCTQMLFGQVTGRCTRHGYRSPELEDADSHHAYGDEPPARTEPCLPLRPPDLVIQDELHLISGPLGSLVGLYETAIDALATWTVNGRTVRPKVIASTATIRRAPEQVRALYARRVEVFPPHGLDVEDNFFARQRAPSADQFGRRYLGVCAPGRRLKAVLIRVYVACLAAAQALLNRYGPAADPWMTLVGYFNSMRELGGMRRLVDDDVRARLRRTDCRGLAIRLLHERSVEELTSRRGSRDIPRVLSRLEMPFTPTSSSKHGSSRRERPIDVLLATNMLAVGVDVQRLGLMVVAGQPKSTAEYIQATSRVGRRAPGLVCTVFNWARPRDLSHYERFRHYHATFYEQVEALSVTPFAPRALDRALSGVLVALVRLRDVALTPNVAARYVHHGHPSVEAAIDAIVRRAGAVAPRPGLRALVEAELSRRLSHWTAASRHQAGGAQLGYEDVQDGVTRGLLRSPGTGTWELFTCLHSLRDVEPSLPLILHDYAMDDEPPANLGTAASTQS